MPTDLLHPDPLLHPSEAPVSPLPGHGAGQGGPPSGRASQDDDVDPELLALPPPPRAERRWTVALLLLVALTASSMVFALGGEAAYALVPGADADIGDLYGVDATKIADNTFVRAHGTLGGALAVRFERPFEGDTYRVSPVMGRRDLWVEVRVPSGGEGGRYVPPTSFSGRLVRWRDSGLRHHGLLQAVNALASGLAPASGGPPGEAISPDARLLVDGESPGAARWTLGLLVMFAGFAAWSVMSAARLVRRVP